MDEHTITLTKEELALIKVLLDFHADDEEETGAHGLYSQEALASLSAKVNPLMPPAEA